MTASLLRLLGLLKEAKKLHMIDIQKLKTTFNGNILSDVETKKAFSRDASIFEIVPELVVQPKTTEDIQALVRFTSEEKQTGQDISLTARAGGTDMTGGSVSESIIIDFTKYINTIGTIRDKTVQVQPGAYYRDLEKITHAEGLEMPSYPASKSICGVGGMVGNNAGGEKSLAYGQTIDWVKNLEVVLSDGNIYTLRPLTEAELANKIKEPTFEGQLYKKIWTLISSNSETIKKAEPTTSKNSAGYFLWKVWNGKYFDLTKLFVGSQGTLGIITNITFKLAPVEPNSQLLVIFLTDLTDLGNIVRQVKNHRPQSFELYDDHTLRLALRFLPDIAKKMGSGIFKLAWQFLPEALMSLRGGLPKLVLLAEFAGQTQEVVSQKAKEAEASIRKDFQVETHITRTEAETQKYWTVRHESFNLLRQHAHGKISSPFVEDIIVHPDELPTFIPKLNAIFARYPTFEYTIAGHAGDANFHIIPFVDLSSQTQREMVERLSDEVYQLILEYHGSFTAEHNDGIVRGPYLERMFGKEMMELFRQTKKIFDPLNIFNPHKKIDATMAYYEKHLRNK